MPVALGSFGGEGEYTPQYTPQHLYHEYAPPPPPPPHYHHIQEPYLRYLLTSSLPGIP